MINYRVAKMSPKNGVIDTKNFDDQISAETYAQKTSLQDNNHSYEVQKISSQINKYQTIVVYERGQEILRSDELLKKQT